MCVCMCPSGSMRVDFCFTFWYPDTESETGQGVLDILLIMILDSFDTLLKSIDVQLTKPCLL